MRSLGGSERMWGRLLRRQGLWLGLTAAVVLVLAGRALGASPFREGVCDKGALLFVDEIPILCVQGTPEEIGQQKAALTGEVVRKIADYPKRLLKLIDKQDCWPKFVKLAEQLEPHFPAAHAAELAAFRRSAGIDRELSIVGNTMVDTYRGGFACSSLLADGSRSQTGGPLFGRNLDFYTLGVLDDCALVTVCRSKGKLAFASVGYPGIIGVVSGMNEAGLAIAVHEVFMARDGSSLWDEKGTPYTLAFRRVLEECTTVDEAEKLLRETPRTTMLNLAVCDRNGPAVIEMTPKTVAMRRGEKGLCACTNNFRTRELATLAWCSRYNTLKKADAIGKLSVADVEKKLDEANQGSMTVQSMVFEPATLKLHLAVGAAPSSAQPYRLIELKPLFEKSRRERIDIAQPPLIAPKRG